MKFGIFISVLVVLVACQNVLSDSPVLLTGNCQLKDLPDNVQKECGAVNCQKDSYGSVSWNRDLCPWARCGYGQRTVKGPADLNKTYPDCCPRYTCE